MFMVHLNGLDVRIPYAPYAAQKYSIEGILQCLTEQTNGVIESPTGTGKSLSILCSVIAWMQNMKEKGTDHGTVYICSRTHKQLDQLLAQLKQLPGAPSMSLLAGRRHLCINDRLKNLPDLDTACKFARKKDAKDIEKCKYYHGTEDISTKVSQVFSIEDLHLAGKKHRLCPYFGLKEATRRAKIVFAPYNYIVNPAIREVLGINLDQATVIIDEGHNIEEVCRSAGTFEIEGTKIASIRLQLVKALAAYSSELNDTQESEREAVGAVKLLLDKMAHYHESKKEEIRKLAKKGAAEEEPELVFQDAKITPELALLGITAENVSVVKKSIRRLACDEETSALGTEAGQILLHMVNIAERLLGPQETRYALVTSQSKICFLCLSADVMFSEILEETRSVVLLSGTLAPFQGVVSELCGKKNEFSVMVEAPHVITTSQVFSACISGYEKNGKRIGLRGTYPNIQHPEYLAGICRAVEQIANSLEGTGGVLCFLPNYKMANEVSQLVKGLQAYKEPQDPNRFNSVLDSYKKECRRGNCVLFCVFRGRASEGVDFRDEQARAVIVVGLPYPYLKSKSVSLKRDFNDRHMPENGIGWYTRQAFKAVNQAIGRCIRHVSDWGAIFFLDERYVWKSNREKVSKWASGHIREYPAISEAVPDFQRFIRDNQTPPKENHLVNPKRKKMC